MKLFLKNAIFTLLVPGTVAFYIPLAIGGHRIDGPFFSTAAGALCVALGAIIALWGIWCFGVIGKGTPAPIDAPRILVIRGPYRHVRNPMYVGVILTLIGWTIYFGNFRLLFYAIAVACGFHLFVVCYEERRLRKEFGADYLQYCQRVRRWIPRLGERPIN